MKNRLVGWTFVCKVLLENRDLIFPSINYGGNELTIAWGEPVLVRNVWYSTWLPRLYYRNMSQKKVQTPECFDKATHA